MTKTYEETLVNGNQRYRWGAWIKTYNFNTVIQFQ